MSKNGIFVVELGGVDTKSMFLPPKVKILRTKMLISQRFMKLLDINIFTNVVTEVIFSLNKLFKDRMRIK